ncbi:MAG: PxxKW family cysteine-rich protein [Thermodesulfobacteriota bacterium]
MNCVTVKENVECPFMTSAGCSFTGGVCKPIVEACEGCKRVAEFPTGRYCTATPDPAAKWKRGRCNLATHIVEAAPVAKAKINPLKASKRAAK